METWRAVPGFEGFYEVSSEGRVRSWHQYGPGLRRSKKPRVLTGSLSRGYRHVNLCFRGQETGKQVHVLVAEAFLGPRPPGTQCAHLNGVRGDCRASNLAWKTPAENEADKVKHGTRIQGESHYDSRLTEDQVREIRNAAATGMSNAELGRIYGVTRQAIRAAVIRKTWKHVE